jgi:hypothetical protein
MKDNLMICFVSKRVASKSSVKATICRSLIVFFIFTSLFDLAGGGSIEISPVGRNRVFIPHSADVAGILLSVVKLGIQNAFGLKLCGFSVTAACQLYLN